MKEDLYKIFPCSSPERMQLILGNLDCNAKEIKKYFDIALTWSPEGIRIFGKSAENLNRAFYVLQRLDKMYADQLHPELATVRYLCEKSYLNEESKLRLAQMNDDVVFCDYKNKFVLAKTLGQQAYVQAVRKHDVCFVNGPAGSGKTYLAVALALSYLKAKKVERLILTRPAIEAGEKLGFLPGDLQEKLDPYMRPLYDALFEMLGPQNYKKYLESSIIEIAPLAYMRGRTLDKSFIILDEAQNTNFDQMKMFLTRIGFSSKAVITGDMSQRDLICDSKSKKMSFQELKKIFTGIEEIDFIELQGEDVVRSRLVRDIIEAYDAYENNAK